MLVSIAPLNLLTSASNAERIAPAETRSLLGPQSRGQAPLEGLRTSDGHLQLVFPAVDAIRCRGCSPCLREAGSDGPGILLDLSLLHRAVNVAFARLVRY